MTNIQLEFTSFLVIIKDYKFNNKNTRLKLKLDLKIKLLLFQTRENVELNAKNTS